MSEKKNKIYQFAVIEQSPLDFSDYVWGRVGKYRLIEDAQKAVETFKIRYPDNKFKIVPYFSGHWIKDAEIEKKEFKKTNSLLWAYLREIGLIDDAREYIKIIKQTIEYEKTHR